MDTGFPVVKGSAVVTSAWPPEGHAARTPTGTTSLALLVIPAAETHARQQAASAAEAPMATNTQCRRAPPVPGTPP